MKKLIICAAVAIAALASCTKTQVINTEDPQEIGFKVISGKMTKAEQTTNDFSQTLGVAAYLGGSEYFDDTEFAKKQGENDWTSATPKYWPLQSTLDFVVWSPKSAATEASNVITFTADNSSCTAMSDQVDYLYGEEIFNFERSENAVSVKLKHALAKVTINFSRADGVGVTVNSVALEKPTLKGTCTVTYDNNGENPRAVWSAQTAETDDITLSEWKDVSLLTTGTSVSFMVVESSSKVASDIKFNYTIDGYPVGDSAEIDLSNATWEGGKHYIYNVVISPVEIKFTPIVNEWGNGGTTNKPL